MKVTSPQMLTNYKQRYIESVRTLSLSKNKFWIKSMVMGDKINPMVGRSQDKKRAYLRTLFKFIDVLNDTYGDDWDMHVSPTMGQSFILMPIIRYKEFTITNSNGASRQIKELIVAIPLTGHYTDSLFTIDDKEYMRISPRTPMGCRMMLHPDEYTSNYHHSHIPRHEWTYDYIGEMYDFCVGDGDIVDVMSNMATANEYDPGYFAFFLSVLDVMVKWESLEGTPFIRMENISRTGQTQTMLTPPSEYPDIFNMFKSEFIGNGFKPTLLLHNNRYKIAENSYLERFVHKILKDNNHHGLLVKQGSTGLVPYGANPVSGTPNLPIERVTGTREIPYIWFSGEKLKASFVEQQTENRENIRDYKTHPKFLKTVTNELEKILLKASIRDNLVEPEYRIVNT